MDPLALNMAVFDDLLLVVNKEDGVWNIPAGEFISKGAPHFKNIELAKGSLRYYGVCVKLVKKK